MVLDSLRRTPIVLLILLTIVPACKEKEKPPVEKKAPHPKPAETSPPAQQSPVPAPPPRSEASSSPASTASVPAASTTPASPTAAAGQPVASTSTPKPMPGRIPAPPVSRHDPAVIKGTTDRDGDVSLDTLAKSLASAIDRAGRAFKGGDADAALAEAIRARRTLPSPEQIKALGAESGSKGETLAKQIEAMRAKLDAALERLEKAGAGDAPGSVMTQDLVIE